MFSVIFRPPAEADALAAQAWYAEHSATTAARFTADLAGTIERVAERPAAFARVHGHVRRAVLHRFPYAVYFFVESEFIVVVAVHGRQDPTRWKVRA